MGNFTFEEMNLMCIYNTGSRTGPVASSPTSASEPIPGVLAAYAGIVIAVLTNAACKRMANSFFLFFFILLIFISFRRSARPLPILSQRPVSGCRVSGQTVPGYGFPELRRESS